MTSRRFYIEPEKISGDRATLDGADAHHLKNVLRLKPGAAIELLDGKGTIFTAIIEKLDKEIDLHIEERLECPPASPAIHIAQGLLKGKKMDFLIQKATELGISSVQPFTSVHGTASNPSANKQSRWQKIMIEACKQCGRAEFMEIKDTVAFSRICETGNTVEERIILWESESEHNLHSIGNIAAIDSLLAVVGPEGGFSEEEVALAQARGFRPVRMGELTLRAESATFSIMAILQFMAGKLG